MKCFQLVKFLLVGVVVLVAVGVVFFGLQSGESGSDEKSSLVDRKYVEVMNVSGKNCPISNEKKPPAKKEYEKSLRFGSIVNKTVEKLNRERFELLLRNLSSFNNPVHKADSGVKASEWIISQLIQTIQNNSDYTGNVTIRRFLHSWKQPTVMVSFEGTDPALKSQLVLLGAELDTNYANLSTPGPGDNVGGSVALLETTRVLLEANFVPKRSIELHWYALSEDIEWERSDIKVAKCYTRSGANVVSVVTFDAICYFFKENDYSTWNSAIKKPLWYWGSPGPEKTDNALAAFLVDVGFWNDTVTNLYCKTEGCYVDRDSWTDYGVTVAWPMVAPCEEHPKNDSQSILNANRALILAKIAIVYAIEAAEPRNVN